MKGTEPFIKPLSIFVCNYVKLKSYQLSKRMLSFFLFKAGRDVRDTADMMSALPSESCVPNSFAGGFIGVPPYKMHSPYFIKR